MEESKCFFVGFSTWKRRKLLKYWFCKKSLRKNATLTSWTLFSSQKGTCSNVKLPFCEEKSVQLVRVAFFRSDFLQNPYFRISHSNKAINVEIQKGSVILEKNIEWFNTRSRSFWPNPQTLEIQESDTCFAWNDRKIGIIQINNWR